MLTSWHQAARLRSSLPGPQAWLLWVLLVLSCWSGTVGAVGASQLATLRKETEDLFYHGFENYMKYAFPEDELRPLTCRPLTRDRDNPSHIEVNDVLGNYSLTLIDSFSTLAILASSPSETRRRKAFALFQDGVRDLVEQYGDGSSGSRAVGKRARGFDLDSKVQVFETTIRGLGGLLSAHLFAVGELPIRNYVPDPDQTRGAQKWDKAVNDGNITGIPWREGFVYDGQLLRLAYDLGTRLIPAFWTSTGIPYPRVNLRHGIPFYAKSPLNFDPEEGQCDPLQKGSAEITETCSAGAGSLLLEFTVLSRLTGDSRFEDLAKRAFWAIWARRSDVDLIGAGIDAETGNWVHSWTGIGAGIDSFFEYAMKAHILLSNEARPVEVERPHIKDPRVLFDALSEAEHSPASFLDAWELAHTAIKKHLYRGPNFQSPHYIQADVSTGAARGFWIDSLSAYYPGLLTLAGYVEEAIESNLLTTALWTRFSALPERWNLITGGVEGGLGWWLGRPEFIESTYYLFRATEDPWYIYVGEMVLRDIKRRCWTTCGWAGIQNVLTGEKIDRMESFFLGETAKYLFLLFDSAHPLNHLDAPFVFTTEGHPLIIPPSVAAGRPKSKRRSSIKMNTLICPGKPPAMPFSMSSIAAREDVYHAGSLARLHLMPTRETVESVVGEYAADHPSIAIAGTSSPSNYTYFPWTLPPDLVPFDAMSSPMPTRPMFDISFPTVPNQAQPAATLQRVKEGILINYLGGLRMGMVQDVPVDSDDYFGDGYRIHSINSLTLGKEERVFLAKDTGQSMLSPTDQYFTRIRDPRMLDIVIDLSWRDEKNSTRADHAGGPESAEVTAGGDGPVKAAWHTFVSHISNLIRDKPQTSGTFIPPPTLGSANKTGNRFYIPAMTSTGIGAAPLADWIEAPSPSATGFPDTALQWSTTYLGDELCNERLSVTAVRTHQVVVIKRGGCSFAQKLANIPSFALSPTSLQLVIVVSYKGEEGMPEDFLVRPLLDEIPMVGKGVPRQNPIPLVLVGGGAQTYEALSRAHGIGVKRRYSVQTRGVPITNLVMI